MYLQSCNFTENKSYIIKLDAHRPSVSEAALHNLHMSMFQMEKIYILTSRQIRVKYFCGNVNKIK